MSYAQLRQAHLVSQMQQMGVVKGVAHIAFLQYGPLFSPFLGWHPCYQQGCQKSIREEWHSSVYRLWESIETESQVL